MRLDGKKDLNIRCVFRGCVVVIYCFFCDIVVL